MIWILYTVYAIPCNLRFFLTYIYALITTRQYKLHFDFSIHVADRSLHLLYDSVCCAPLCLLCYHGLYSNTFHVRIRINAKLIVLYSEPSYLWILYFYDLMLSVKDDSFKILSIKSIFPIQIVLNFISLKGTKDKHRKRQFCFIFATYDNARQEKRCILELKKLKFTSFHQV